MLYLMESDEFNVLAFDIGNTNKQLLAIHSYAIYIWNMLLLKKKMRSVLYDNFLEVKAHTSTRAI